MKKLALCLFLSFTSIISYASCTQTYIEASGTDPDIRKVDMGTKVGSSIIVGMDAMVLGMGSPIPVFTVSGAIYSLYVSIDWHQREEYRIIKKILVDAKYGAYSSDMEDLHLYVEESTGYSISVDDLQNTIMRLNDKNIFCTNGVQGMDDFKFNIARNYRRF